MKVKKKPKNEALPPKKKYSAKPDVSFFLCEFFFYFDCKLKRNVVASRLFSEQIINKLTALSHVNRLPIVLSTSSWLDILVLV